MTNFWKQGYVLLQLLLLGQIYTIFFEDGFDHHYTYSSVSDIFGVHNVTTVIKVNPEGIWCQNDVILTSMRRDDVASTLIRRHFGTKCPLGKAPSYRHTIDGWITCDFTSFSTVFQSYQDDGQMIMKGCVQWNSVYGVRLSRFRLERGSNSVR